MTVQNRPKPSTSPGGGLHVEQLRAGEFRLTGTRVEPASKRAAAGMLAQANGAAGEDLVAAHHRRCLERGVAYLRKCDPTFHPLGELAASDVKGTRERIRALVGKLFGFFRSKAGVDYLGWTLTPLGTMGVPIVAECKSTEGGYLHLARVEPAQRDELELARGRAIAALLVVHAGRLHAVPWDAARGRASLTARDLEAFAVGDDECWPARWSDHR